jgi:protein-S-isoprenylcysteine O-methyltransferase Ste14
MRAEAKHVLDMKRIAQARKQKLWAIGFALLAIVIFDRASWKDESVIPLVIIWTGVLFLIVAICGRCWTMAYLGRRKRLRVMASGPYSMVRHPLYMFSIIGAVGVGAQSASLVMTFLVALPIWFVFDRAAQYEEAYMTAQFGDIYRGYQSRTRRFWPNPLLWSSPGQTAFDYALVAQTFRDSLYFALAPLMFVGLRWSHGAHLVPVFYQTP